MRFLSILPAALIHPLKIIHFRLKKKFCIITYRKHIQIKKLVSGTEFQNSFFKIASKLLFPLFEKWVAVKKAVLD